MNKKKILFVNDEMVVGGVARILCTLLKLMDRDKYEIDLLVLHNHGELIKEVPSDINIIPGTSFFNTIDIPLKECSFLNIFSKIRLLLSMKSGSIKNKIISERKKILKKHYDIEFAAKEGFCTIFTAYGDSDKKINWVQTDYKVNNYAAHHMDLMKDALKNIDSNIACSKQVEESFKEVFRVNNTCVIHNPIDNDRIKLLSEINCSFEINKEKINLITVARFHPQKSLDRLIKAYSNYQDYYSLTIIGGGTQKNELYELAKSLNVFDKIKWLGILDNPYNIIKNSDLFIMTSLYEGYPTIIPETLISGTPILTTRVAGVEEQLTSKEHGFIVENNIESIQNKLNELKDKKDLLLDYKEKLLNYKYDNDTIMNRIYQLF